MLEHLNDILENTQITASTAAVRLAISFVLGAIIGVERQFRRRDAGMRTFTLICMGSAAAMLISIWIPQTYTGIGFLGAGAIIQSHGSVHGLTTAACIWVMAVVGLAAGAGMFLAASITTAFTLFVLVSLERLERRMYLDVNKILTINCSTSTPDLKGIRKILENRSIFIVSLSYEHNYDKNTSTITYKVNVKSKSSYSELFTEIRKLGYISQIRLLA